MDEDIYLYWYDPNNGVDVLEETISAPHSGSFNHFWTQTVLANTVYIVKVASEFSYLYPNGVIQVSLQTPCSNWYTPTASAPTETPTAEPVNLSIGQLELISTPPIIAYRPVQFQAVISNTGC